MKRLGLMLGVAVAIGAACYPGDVTSISELDAVVTVRNPDFTFSSSLTFAMPDTIIQINEGDDGAIDIDRGNDAEILARVRTNLLALGWNELDANAIQGGAIPDLAIGNLVMARENTQWWVSYPPGCWYPYWCWGWYWPPVIGSTSYDAGSYFVVAVDASSLSSIGALDSLEGAWGGAMNGVLSSSTTSNVTRLLQGIDQMFEQSPYLNGSSSN